MTAPQQPAGEPQERELTWADRDLIPAGYAKLAFTGKDGSTIAALIRVADFIRDHRESAVAEAVKQERERAGKLVEALQSICDIDEVYQSPTISSIRKGRAALAAYRAGPEGGRG